MESRNLMVGEVKTQEMVYSEDKLNWLCATRNVSTYSVSPICFLVSKMNQIWIQIQIKIMAFIIEIKSS